MLYELGYVYEYFITEKKKKKMAIIFTNNNKDILHDRYTYMHVRIYALIFNVRYRNFRYSL